jgi:hypothetical protein
MHEQPMLVASRTVFVVRGVRVIGVGMALNCLFSSQQGPDYEKFAKYKKTDKFAEMLGLRPEPKKNMLGTLCTV